MSSLTLLAQQYLSISPRHVSLLTLDGGRPSAVVAASAAFDPLNRVFFVEWDDPSDASSFRISHVLVPCGNSSGGGVTALALTTDASGTVHCVVSSRGAKGHGGASHLYRRHCPAGEAEGGAPVVRYVRLPGPHGPHGPISSGADGADGAMRADGGSRVWTAALPLGRSDGSAGRVAAACGGTRGEANALQLLRLAGLQLSLLRHVELPALAGFPVLQLCEVDGDAAALLALCHDAVVEVDLRLPHAGAVVRAWRWSPHDLLTSFALRDNAIAAGTEDGVVVLWDMRHAAVRERNGRAVDHSAPCGAPVTGLHMPHRTSLLSCHADGAVLSWDQQRQHSQQYLHQAAVEGGGDTGFAFAARRVDALPPVFVGSPGCVGLAAEDGIAVVADESGTLSIFAVT